MVEHFTHTEAGHGHSNEDRVLVREHPADASLLLCALADGQGGRSGGALAAELAIAEALRAAERFAPAELATPSVWRAVGYAADRAVSDDAEAGFTTLVALAVGDGAVTGCSAGDSAALLVVDGRAVVLTEAQSKNPPVGSLAANFVSFGADLAGDWKLIAMSDGVWKVVGWEAIVALCASHDGPRLLDALRREAVARAGDALPDDFTVALFEPAL